MKTIGVVTVGRSDYGIYLPILKKIKADPHLRLCLIASGMHWSPTIGLTYKEIEADGFEMTEQVKIPSDSDTPADIAKSIGHYTVGFAKVYARQKPDILVVLGDRFEMFAAALAALPFKIPVAHIHGGELTRGAIDDALRHSMTKMSHLHFVATPEYARRVIQLGEEPWRVHVCGAPSLDHLKSIKLMQKKELEMRYGISISKRPFLVTFHPVTLEYEKSEKQITELLAALRVFRRPTIFTMPNADTYHSVIRRKIREFAAKNSWVQVVENLGTRGYFSLMALSAVMVGNSSSGIIEAASVKLPVVNIGTRQEDRLRTANIVDVGYARQDIIAGIKKVLSKTFCRAVKTLVNPYDQGGAAEKIVKILKAAPLHNRLLMKRFHDLTTASDSKQAPGNSCIVLGSGGHARVVLDCLRTMNAVAVYGILDSDRTKWGKTFYGVSVLGDDKLLSKIAKKNVKYFVLGLGGIGNSQTRERLFRKALRKGLKPLSLIHPTSVCSSRAEIGPGSQLFPGSIVNAGCRTGKNVIVNTGAIVEHDCFLGDFCYIATGAKLAGAVRIGRGAFVGAGAIVKQGVSIGARAVVGAGSVVIRNVMPKKVVVGVPARYLR